jgi:hypothetical protein
MCLVAARKGKENVLMICQTRMTIALVFEVQRSLGKDDMISHDSTYTRIIYFVV